MYINYDLARVLLEERRMQAKIRAQARQRAPKPAFITPVPEADVIELSFGTHCGTDQIGA